MKNISVLVLASIIIFSSVFSSCKKKSKDEDPGASEEKKKGVLVIENGARRSEPGQATQYTAHIIAEDGTISNATNVSWSVSDQNVATVSGNIISAAGSGNATITASVEFGGSTLTTSVPLNVSLPSAFGVLPGGIAWFADNSSLQLQPVYVGTGNPGTYTYSSSNASVASVSSTGLVTFAGAGSCVITVTAPGLSGSPTYEVPVVLVGEISVPIPVTKVVIDPSSQDIFINDQFTFTAKAYDFNNAEVSRTFSWDVLYDSIATIDVNGKVTGLRTGTTKVYATTDGIIAEAELFVYPDKIIEVSPMIANIAASKTRQFTAKTYQVSKAGGSFSLSQISNPGDLKWEIPSYGISMFDIATVNTNGLVTVKNDAMAGFMTIVLAYSPSDETIGGGAGIVQVSTCDCGEGSGSTSITPTQSTFNLNMMSSPTAQITANTSPSGGTLHYCTQDPSIVSVSETGMISALSPGTGTITICDGDVSTTVTVNVSF